MAGVTVVGSGYVGTVVAACFAAVLDHDVVALEVDPHKLASLRRAQAPIHEPSLDGLLGAAVTTGRLRFTDDVRCALADADVVFICVGTPAGADGRPDLTATEAAVRAIAGALDRHRVIVTKSTVPIGCGAWIRSVIQDALPPEARGERRFSLVSNPEFLREGSAVHDFLFPDRIVIGGDEPDAIAAVTELYSPIIEQRFPQGNGKRPSLVLTSLETAETIKYAANAFLATKISFINEIAAVCERVGADVTEVASAMGLDARIGAAFLEAGIGWGGSCFGKDLSALITAADEHGYQPRVLEAVRAVNTGQRVAAVEKLRHHLQTLRGRRIGLLGLAFKPGTDDTRDSPAVDIAMRLVDAGAFVTAHDPAVRSLPPVQQIRLVDDPYAVADNADAVVLATDWPQFSHLEFPVLADRMRGELVLDGRNAFDPGAVTAAGLRYEGFGRIVSSDQRSTRSMPSQIAFERYGTLREWQGPDSRALRSMEDTLSER